MNEDDQTVPEDQGLSDQVLKISAFLVYMQAA